MLTTDPIVADDNEIRAMLAEADVPVLCMVLVHLTGDRRWMDPPFEPKRDISFFADESGGMSEEIGAEVREAAFRELVRLRDGGALPETIPPVAQLSEMMSRCVAEQVGEEYVPMMLEEMGLADRDAPWRPEVRRAVPEGFRVLIVGAGMSGICLGAKLGQAGIPYVIVEKNEHLGGTWWENTYPEVGCDVPNHFYSFSKRPNPDWTGYFSKGPEILRYLEVCAEEAGVAPHIRYGAEVTSVAWDDDAAEWSASLRCTDGSEDSIRASCVVSAVGQLNRPKLPAIDGLEAFAGPIFHTAQWDHSVSLAGKRVAVIGTGASAMQLLRTTAEIAERVTVFQRSAQWAIPARDYHREVSAAKQWLLRHVPFYLGWYRFTLAWRFGDHLLPAVVIDPEWEHPERSVSARNDRHREYLTEYIKSEIGDRVDLLPKVLPTYPPYGKRILVDNHWFRTMTRDDVDLVTDPIARITERGVELESGEEIPADVIVLATGFETSKMIWPMEVRGRGGATLRELWGDDDAQAYLGITIPGFPNLFCMYGPNTNLGHGGSIIFVAECQARYIMGCLTQMLEEEASSLEVTEAAFRDYIRRIDEGHARLIWSHQGMDTWYRNKHGRVVSILPWRVVDYWQLTEAPDPAHYTVGGRAVPGATA